MDNKEDYESGHSSEEESGSEASGQQSEEELMPYPFLGRPYVTNSILNTIDVRLISEALKEVQRTPLKCIQLRVADKLKTKYSLHHILFGSQAVSFSNIAAKLVVVTTNKTLPLVGLLGLPVTEEQKVEALKSVNGFFSGTVSDTGVHLQESIANKEMVADVPMIIRALASLTCPPWVIHQECWLEKGEGSCDVPHGKIDAVIGKPTGDLTTLPGASVVVALIKKFTPIASVSAKVQDQFERPKSERQVLLELLAFAEVIREDGPVVMIKASKYTFRVYIYIRALDLLFRGPSFNYNSTTCRKLKDSIKGLAVLCSILNNDVKEYFKHSYDTFKKEFSCFEKCGWAKAMRESKASYKQEVMIEQPGLSSTHSPSPTPQEETSDDDDFAGNVVRWSDEFQRKKVKVSSD